VSCGKEEEGMDESGVVNFFVCCGQGQALYFKY
jgi:hypothetical protein